jgi:hypothetical protein
MNQLSADDKDLKSYLGRPIGNSPKMMPWDCSLNKDLKDAVLQHMCYTCHLPEEHDRKFSLSTPKRGSWAFRQIWLPKKRANPKIQEAKGTLIPGIGDQKGRRALQQHVSCINRRGGTRVRKPANDRVHWIHLHAQPAYALKLETSTSVHAACGEQGEAQVEEDEGEDCL